MTELFEQALKVTRACPPERQDEIARMILEYAALEGAMPHLKPEGEAHLREAKAASERTETAVDAGVQAVSSKRRR